MRIRMSTPRMQFVLPHIKGIPIILFPDYVTTLVVILFFFKKYVIEWIYIFLSFCFIFLVPLFFLEWLSWEWFVKRDILELFVKWFWSQLLWDSPIRTQIDSFWFIFLAFGGMCTRDFLMLCLIFLAGGHRVYGQHGKSSCRIQVLLLDVDPIEQLNQGHLLPLVIQLTLDDLPCQSNFSIMYDTKQHHRTHIFFPMHATTP